MKISILLLFLTILSCCKPEVTPIAPEKEHINSITIAEAREYYNKEIVSNSLARISNGMDSSELLRILLFGI